ncbi:hypothetical protein SH501x_001899 [Pirellulaceae bacterium SH501]
MQPDQYTADTICHSMSLGPLLDPSWDSDDLAIRVLLKRSFDPEACITATRRKGIVRLNVVVLVEFLWHQQHPCRLPVFHDDTALSLNQFDRIAHFHHSAVTDIAAQRFVSIDGMGLDCVWRVGGRNHQIQSHCSAYGPMTEFIVQTIEMAWQSSSNAGVRNGLARCGRYVGLNLPVEPEPPTPALYRLGVFGVRDHVDDYFRVLRSFSNEE